MENFKLLIAAGAIVVLGTSSAGAADSRTYVLTVSVSQYPKLPKFRPLDHADTAAKRLHDVLLAQTPRDKQESHFLVCGADSAKHPTAKNIRDVLVRFAQLVRAEDRVLVVFLGHGFENKSGAVLVTYDSELTDPNSFITVREIEGRLKAMRCGERCAFLDACRDFRDDLQVKEVTGYQDPNDSVRIAAGTRKAGSTFIVQSCEPGEVAFERNDGAGLMTERLIEAFTKPGAADANSNGEVTVSEAVIYARRWVKDDARFYHRAVQNLSDMSSGDPFVLAKVSRLAPGAPVDSGVAQKPPLPYRSEDIPFGSLPSPSSTGRGSVDRPVVNAAIKGIPHDSRAGQVLDLINRSPIPSDVKQYIPTASTPLVSQIRRWVR